MQYMRFDVTLRVPDHARREDVERDLRTSIGFGQPQIEFTGWAIFSDEEEAEDH